MADAPAPLDPKAAPAAPVAASAGGFGKKKLIIIAVAAVVVIAGGVGGYLALSHRGDHTAQADEGDDAEAASDDKAKAGKKDKGKAKKNAKPAKPKGPAIYVKLEPPFVVNFEAKGLMRFLQVAAEVMTRDAETAEILKQNDPMIRNDLLLMLSSQTYETISTTEGKEQIRAQALKVIGKIVESEGGKADNVEQLYFTSFVMQ